MATYATATPVQERYLDFRALLTSENLNKKQVKFWTDESKFIIRGFNVSHDPITKTITVTEGAAVKDYVLLVLNTAVTLTYTGTLGGCVVVALQYNYISTTCPSDCSIVVLDAVDFDPNSMLLIAMIDDTGNVVYPVDTTTPIGGAVPPCLAPEPRKTLSGISGAFTIARVWFSPAATTNNVQLLVDADDNKKIFIYLNGALLTETVDYTLDKTTPGNFRVNFTQNVYTYDVIEQVAIGGWYL